MMSSLQQTLILLLDFYDHCLSQWEKSHIPPTQTALMRLIENNHCLNYQLWHKENQARRDDLGFEHVYHAKRDIDKLNQERNDAMEHIDHYLYEILHPRSPENGGTLHSETPGMIIDRLSILSLKRFYMYQQTLRQEVNAIHRSQSNEKYHILTQQRDLLHQCLLQLIAYIETGSHTFIRYRQFKMYNDKTLNPALYTQDT